MSVEEDLDLIKMFRIRRKKSKVDPSATLTLAGTDENWSYVEVLVSEGGDNIMIQ